MSVMAELSIFPMDKGASVSPYVARAVDVIRESGLPYVFGPMATSIEGETFEAVMDVVGACYKALSPDCGRIHVALRLDCRKGPMGRLTGKMQSVLAKTKTGEP
ncbi:MTH1187 family thiamine-binding protein [Desulfovibrio sulfodismutans]|uniref:MTH1187 family thiamine-binding protein n=1 Tax=Desulfolutivibrio sulfodismutans TaxID=63561 RepID=A0A7K3NSN4_9BACT|nr:MTH1187 family thiamine-binding protein [Desulfolutivibrio sulfodismutans]NDY58805.1 MTH1187 family thiamine-binding protein [Desulfolutivibrio sulfodismutans]QLA11543.1 MTH1187 family thiamine-binding protein [Desulfolutivibrio sulfodismutans DSM 3696]